MRVHNSRFAIYTVQLERSTIHCGQTVNIHLHVQHYTMSYSKLSFYTKSIRAVIANLLRKAIILHAVLFWFAFLPNFIMSFFVPFIMGFILCLALFVERGNVKREYHPNLPFIYRMGRSIMHLQYHLTIHIRLYLVGLHDTIFIEGNSNTTYSSFIHNFFIIIKTFWKIQSYKYVMSYALLKKKKCSVKFFRHQTERFALFQKTQPTFMNPFDTVPCFFLKNMDASYIYFFYFSCCRPSRSF